MRGPGVALNWLLILMLGLTTTAQAAREIEPNNSAGQATLVDPSQEILGTIQDDFDFFKVILPEDGRVEVRVDNYPPGTELRIGANGFSESDDELLAEKTNQGRDSVRLTFAAQERVGFVWIEVLFADKVCQNEWCVMQLVKEGPWYTLKDGIVPPEWQEREILEPPEYRLTIRQAAMAFNTKKPEQPQKRPPGYRSYTDPASGLAFEHPGSWVVGPGARPGTWLVQPASKADHAMKIDLEVIRKNDMPGSSPEKQLNLIERDLEMQGAEIRKRGQMTVASADSPYLVAVLPSKDSTETARMQVVVPFSDHYIRVGYFGPGNDYPKAVKVFEHLLESLAINPVETVKPAEK